MWALLSEWLKKAGMALKHVGLTISQNNRQGETHTWISQKRNEGKQTKPKVKGALSNKFQGQALGLGRILCLTCFFFLENDCSEKSLVDPVDWTSSSLQFLHVSIFIRCRKNVGPGFSTIFDGFLSMIGFSSGYISSDTFLFSVLNLMSEFTP